MCSVPDPSFALSFLFANCVKKVIGLSYFCDLLRAFSSRAVGAGPPSNNVGIVYSFSPERLPKKRQRN